MPNLKVKLTRKQIFSEIRAYIIMTLGLTIYAFAWIAIITPAKFIGGGIPGVSTLIVEATNGFLEMGTIYFGINAILLLVALVVIGPAFGIKTVYAMCYMSLALSVLPSIVSPDLVGLQEDKLLSAILGGALCGLGIGICFSQGGSTGGTDIIAMIVNKYHNVSLGKVIMLCDVIIIGCSFFIYHNISAIIYGYVTLGLTGYTIDAVLQGNRQSCQLMVISKHYPQIADTIVSNAHRGVTVLDGSGWYTKNPQKILMIFCRRNESTAICRIIKEKDPDAFISNAAISGVYGNGFENLKLKQKQ
ncbi:MAG: YitT family protein [Rikenellaceae bacterium]|nr:YitT family protein [Rikenellaceae bacterium]MDE7355217.1 YitT family protein [Rikenellaceae bacterium]